MKLIVGLGNPGKKYEKTRHNIGFMVIDELLREFNITNSLNKFQGLFYEKNIDGEKIIFLKPQTYMNLSGKSIIEAVNFYKLDIENELIVVFDDMDLELGRIRIKERGSSGGHNGIKSIIQFLGQDFIRIKCGIGKAKYDVVDFVTGTFNNDEQEKVEKMIKKSVDCLIDIIKGTKINQIMQLYNTK